MNGQDQQSKRSAFEDGMVAAHVLAGGMMTLCKCNLGSRVYSAGVAMAGYFIQAFLVAYMPAPPELAAIAMPLWAFGYPCLALVHLAIQKRNMEAGTLVHSAYVGDWIVDGFSGLQGDGVMKVVRTLLMLAWIGWWCVALPGVGFSILAGAVAEHALLARTKAKEQWIDQDMFDAMIDAERRQQRMNDLQGRRW